VRRTTIPRASALVAGVLAIAALAGCTGAPHPSPSATQLPTGITTSLVQLRADVAERQAQVQIHNGADDTLRIGEVSLEDPRFDGVAGRVVSRESEVPIGGTVNVRVQLPPMDCAAPDEGVSLVEVEFGVGAAESVARMQITDTLGFLPELHRRECLSDALAEVATVSLASFTAAPAGEAGAVELAVEPTGAGTAQLVAVNATPLLMYAIGGRAESRPIAVDVTPEAGTTLVEIPVVPQRCDPHVVQEDKRGTVFTFDVVVDGVEGQVDIPAAPEMKAEILTWVGQWCGFGSG
jgi:hypothetical protein